MSFKDKALGVWKDPVWSKVIAVAICAIAGGVWAYFNWDKTKEWLLKIVDFKFNVVYVVLAIVVLFLLYKLFTRKRLTKEDKIRQELEQFNSALNEDGTVRFTWEVGIQTLAGSDPYAYNIQSFCLLHDVPLRFRHHCKEWNCQNHHVALQEYDLKNWIESNLIERYSLLKVKYK